MSLVQERPWTSIDPTPWKSFPTILEEISHALLDMGIPQSAVPGYATVLENDGFDTAFAFLCLTPEELARDYGFKRGHIRLVLEDRLRAQRQEAQRQEAQQPEPEPEPTLEPEPLPESVLAPLRAEFEAMKAPLRAELTAMKIGALRTLAAKMGVEVEQLGAADDADDKFWWSEFQATLESDEQATSGKRRRPG